MWFAIYKHLNSKTWQFRWELWNGSSEMHICMFDVSNFLCVLQKRPRNKFSRLYFIYIYIYIYTYIYSPNEAASGIGWWMSNLFYCLKTCKNSHSQLHYATLQQAEARDRLSHWDDSGQVSSANCQVSELPSNWW